MANNILLLRIVQHFSSFYYYYVQSVYFADYGKISPTQLNLAQNGHFSQMQCSGRNIYIKQNLNHHIPGNTFILVS